MPKTTRTRTPKYDPKADARQRWPHWYIAAIDLPELGEDFDLENQIIAIEPVPTARHAYAHALAHLDLGHHETPGRNFAAEQCDDADALALVRLNDFTLPILFQHPAFDEPTFDGPPTLIMKGMR